MYVCPHHKAKEERYTDITSAAEQEKEMPSVQETNVGTDQKDDFDSLEVKEEELVLEMSNTCEEYATSNTC